MIVEFRAAARAELIEAGRWYLEDGGVKVAERFEAAVQRALALLSAVPTIGTPAYPPTRSWPLRRFPYTLVYRVQGSTLTVVAVAHQSRAPGYWGTR